MHNRDNDITTADIGLNAHVRGAGLSSGNWCEGKGKIVDVTDGGDVVHVKINGSVEQFRQWECKGTGM